MVRKRKFYPSNRFDRGRKPWNKGLEGVRSSGKDKIEQKATLVRIKRMEMDTLPQSTANYNFTMVTKLRPRREKEESFITENIICGVKELETLLNASLEKHSNCWGDLKLRISHRNGLGVTLAASCSNIECSSRTTEVPMSRQYRNGQRGPMAFELNDLCTVAAMKTKCGPSDIRFFLAALNIKPPTRTLVYRNFDRTAKTMQYMNEESMRMNRILTTNMKKSVNVEVDTMYNNRPQQGCEAGTQSFTPIIDIETGLVLGCETANKLCPKRGCNHENCAKNYRTEATIASSEKKSTSLNLEKLKKEGLLKVESMTSDGSSQMEKFAKSKKLTHYNCLVHRMRNFQKALKKNFKLTTKTRPGEDKKTFVKKLSAALRSRIYREIKRCRQRRGPQFVKAAGIAINNVIPCFCNEHSRCKKISKVCQQLDTPKFLPYGKYLQINKKDRDSLQKIITQYFSPIRLTKISANFNTNKCEALNHRVTTYAPKCTTYAKNFRPLCASAIHSKTFGTGLSTMKLTKLLTHNTQHTQTEQFMNQLDRTYKYDTARQISNKYKNRRHFSKKARNNRALLDGNINTQPTLSMQHSYALSPY